MGAGPSCRHPWPVSGGMPPPCAGWQTSCTHGPRSPGWSPARVPWRGTLLAADTRPCECKGTRWSKGGKQGTQQISPSCKPTCCPQLQPRCKAITQPSLLPLVLLECCSIPVVTPLHPCITLAASPSHPCPSMELTLPQTSPRRGKHNKERPGSSAKLCHEPGAGVVSWEPGISGGFWKEG